MLRGTGGVSLRRSTETRFNVRDTLSVLGQIVLHQ